MPSLRVLIIEDNPNLLTLLLDALPLLGDFQVFGATDGREGLLHCEQIQPDCVVVDVLLPELNGYQCVRALGGDPATSQTAIILCTALAENRDRFVGLACGADLYVTKPILPAELARAIQQVAARTPTERAAAYLTLVHAQGTE